MVSYDPQRYQQAISGSSGVQSAGRITQPTVIEDEEESQFSFKPAPASFHFMNTATTNTDFISHTGLTFSSPNWTNGDKMKVVYTISM